VNVSLNSFHYSTKFHNKKTKIKIKNKKLTTPEAVLETASNLVWPKLKSFDKRSRAGFPISAKSDGDIILLIKKFFLF